MVPLRHLRWPVLMASRSSRYSAHGRQWPPTRCPLLGPERIILRLECPDQGGGKARDAHYTTIGQFTSHVAFQRGRWRGRYSNRCCLRNPLIEIRSPVLSSISHTILEIGPTNSRRRRQPANASPASANAKEVIGCEIDAKEHEPSGLTHEPGTHASRVPSGIAVMRAVERATRAKLTMMGGAAEANFITFFAAPLGRAEENFTP